MAWSPQRSKDTYAPIRSVAYARTHGGFEPPPDPAGSVMYLVCNRRRQIWRLKPNIGQTGATAFTVEASRGPLWPDTPTLRATMGDIGGDSTGAWYIETPHPSQVNGPTKITYAGDDGINRTVTPTIHRLDGDLNLVASYRFAWSPSAGIFFLGTWGLSTGMGGGSSIVMAAQQVNSLNTSGDSIAIPGGIVSASVATMQSQASRVFQSGTSVMLVKVAANPTATWTGTATAATGGLPLPNYGNILDPVNPQITSCDGNGGDVYACKTGGTDYMARWSGGNLVAYKTPANATPQDQFRAQCIGGSSSVCYTTENNNEIVLRDGGLNLTARFRRADIELFLGASNPANGISNFTFTGIGGR